eukprot:3796561-Alexandrium_andersonii.AAC.1
MAAKAVAAEEIPAGCVALAMWADSPVAPWPNPQEGAAPWVRCEADGPLRNRRRRPNCRWAVDWCPTRRRYAANLVAAEHIPAGRELLAEAAPHVSAGGDGCPDVV